MIYDFDPSYESIKKLATRERSARNKIYGRYSEAAKFNTNELLALDKQNDPFYFGTPANVAMAEWFRDIWEEKGYTRGKHIRRIHYEISTESEKQYYRHDGEPYVNNDKCRAYLHFAATAARHLGLLEADQFEDMRLKGGVIEFRGIPRDGEPVVGIEQTEEREFYWPRPEIYLMGDIASYDVPSYTVTGYDYTDDDQPYRVEAWFEKEIGTNALIPVCQRHQIHLLVGLGNISITQADLLLRRSVSDERPLRILYFSDWDVTGHQMPVSVARQVEYLIHTKYHDTKDVAFHRIAITPEQIRGDNPRGVPLPRKDVYLKYEDPTQWSSEKERQKHKPTYSRVKNFEERHGAGQTELNALAEEEIAHILAQAASYYRDPDYEQRLSQLQRQLQREVDTERNHRTVPYELALDELIRQQREVVERYQPIVEKLQARMDRELEDVYTRVDEIKEEIEEGLEGFEEDVEASLPDRLEPEVGGDHDAPLYHSDRAYFEQLNFYKRHQGREEFEPVSE